MLPQPDGLALSDHELERYLLSGTLPRHVAIIMDGNGRWAADRGQPRHAGHREGVYSAREAVETCRVLGIPALTLYAFSLENWRRPRDEVGMLMDLFYEYFQSECEHFVNKGVRVRAIGRLELLPRPLRSIIRELEQVSRGQDELTVTLALSYGGRAEIVDAVKKILFDAERGMIGREGLDEEAFSRYLETTDLPEPDLLIRTSGETRVSNFLLWQIAYAELYFTKTNWPDFRRRDFLLALLEYQRRERRLGGLGVGQSGSTGHGAGGIPPVQSERPSVEQPRRHEWEEDGFGPLDGELVSTPACQGSAWLE